MSHMYVIAGLGNIGEKYVHTRHNAGRQCVDFWVVTHGGKFVLSKKYGGEVWEGTIGKEKVLALLPQTFMNESGGSIKKAVTSKKQAEALIVLHDDIDLPLGTIRISFNRGSGGHNGIKSIAESIKTEAFIRIRIGVSPMIGGKTRKPKDAEAVLGWVMSDFKKSEQDTWHEVQVRVGKSLECIIEKGVMVAMNMFN